MEATGTWMFHNIGLECEKYKCHSSLFHIAFDHFLVAINKVVNFKT